MDASGMKKKMMIRKITKILMLVVFVGIIMIWIMTPTALHKNHWLPKIKKVTNTTYFGAQGANILEYMFPMLFVAVLGCIYLHFGSKTGDNHMEKSAGKKSGGLWGWKRPVLVKGPLGVVSWIGFTFLVMFVALLVWSFGTYLQISYSAITHETALAKGREVWEDKLRSASLRLGYIGNICMAFLFFPVTRGSSLLPLIGLTSESSIKYHIWLGHITMTLFSIHSLGFIIFWASTQELSELLEWSNTGVSNIAGELAWVAGLVLWATTFPSIRRKAFEIFFYTHYLYILFVVFFVYHVGISDSYMFLPGVYLFMVDRYLRFLQSRKNIRMLSSRLLPCETVELNFSKSTGLEYSPTSILFVNVPSISTLQWHPFTISSNSNLEPEKLSIVIKKEGSWSQKLYNVLASPSSVDRLDVAVEGPYGPASTNLLRHETLVMISGGSGITPFFSIIRELIFTSSVMNRKTPRILLVCAFRNSADLTMLDLLLPISGTPSDISRLHMQIDAYVTREQHAGTAIESKSPIRTIWFKPNAPDRPISAILGPNNWLWLAAIISCSFVIFLILLGLINRFYTYRIDHNAVATHMMHMHNLPMPKIYSYAARASINMLLICVCIVLTCSVVFVKNKNRSAMEAKQVQITDSDTPTTSPGSWFHNADKELESHPNESLLRATNVYYGSRPNLKKILLECEGSSVGVYASGPKEMRHEVAAICSSGLADDLHFESISFSW